MSIVTDGLIGYWNSKQGFAGGVWKNIAPSTVGHYDGIINGAILTNDRVYFDGIDDVIKHPISPISTNSNITIEVAFNIQEDDFYHTLLLLANITTMNVIQLYVTSNGVGVYITNGSYNDDDNNVNYSYYYNQDMLFTVCINGQTKEITYYLNGEYIGNATANIDAFNMDELQIGNIYIGDVPYGSFYGMKGYIYSVKLYNKLLTYEEIQQNYENGIEIGLGEEIPETDYPKPIILNVSKHVISDEPGMDKTYITFKFDQDVVEWTINVLGVDHQTGFVAESGGPAPANAELVAEIDWTELYQEGLNRVNIYGKNANGKWTPYFEE